MRCEYIAASHGIPPNNSMQRTARAAGDAERSEACASVGSTNLPQGSTGFGVVGPKLAGCSRDAHGRSAPTPSPALERIPHVEPHFVAS